MRWMVIALPLAILIDCIAFINFFEWHQQSVYEFEQRQLDIQVNYAIDAAAQEMLNNSTHVDTDYIDWGSITVEPELALDVFQTMMLKSMGWSVSDENKEAFMQDMCPFFIVAAYDGYYVYSQVPYYIGIDTADEDKEYNDLNGDGVVDKDDYIAVSYPHRWTPKIPYGEMVGNKYYFYNLGESHYGTLVNSASGKTVKYDNIIKVTTEDEVGSTARADFIINDRLTQACNEALVWGLADRGGSKEVWYLPTTYTNWTSTNPIESPTLLSYVQSAGITKYEKVSFGIEGSRIDEAEFCILYKDTVTGELLYTYATNRDKVESLGFTVISIVSTCKEAAERGYHYDTRFL